MDDGRHLPRIVISAERKRGDSRALKVCGPAGRTIRQCALESVGTKEEESRTYYVAGAVGDEEQRGDCGFLGVPCDVAGDQGQ